MKKFYISLLTFILAAIQLTAAPVDPEKALEIANEFWASNVTLKKNMQSRLVPAKRALKASSDIKQPKEEHETFYIFNEADNNGFVIVSGEDRLSPIVGYSTNSASGEMPPALTAWLEDYSEYVSDVRAGKAKASSHNARVASQAIAPMLVTAWSQEEPYNNMCPMLNGQRTYTGCGNTAAAQVMRFHEWPASPIADVEWENNITGETEFCELQSHVYDWDNMIYSYSSGYSEAEGDAVALLMADLGKATQSTYNAEGTGNTEFDIANALVNIFDYSPELLIATRCDYTYEEYIALIRENLSNRQPIIYCGYGQSYEGGHGFVCDGIDENNLLHIDWGWDGSCNGYFDMAIMEPENNGIGGFSDRYNVGQIAITNIKPRADGEVNKGCTPTLAMMDVYDEKTEEEVDEQTAEFVDGIAEAAFTLGIINRSHSDAVGAIGIGILDMEGKLARDIEFDEIETYPCSYDNIYSDTFWLSVSNDSDSEEYLPAGKYVIGAFYMNSEEEVKYMRGAYNGLVLEVTEDAITLSPATPRFELDELCVVTMPKYPNSNLVFNATFANNSKLNRTVILVPVINYYEDGMLVESQRKPDSAVTIEILDVNNVIATFTIPRAFAQSGTYTISFEYQTINSEKLDESGILGVFDTSKLIAVASESEPIEAEIIAVEDEGYDYSFSIEFVGQETIDGTEVATMRTIMGEDLSKYKFLITGTTDEDELEEYVEYLVSDECTDSYTMNKSIELKVSLPAGEYAIVVVLYDIDGELLDEYYTKIFSLTTGIEKVGDNEPGISFDSNNNVISVAKAGVIELFDASGRLVKRANSNNVSIAGLEAGTYIVRYNNNTIKVMKK